MWLRRIWYNTDCTQQQSSRWYFVTTSFPGLRVYHRHIHLSAEFCLEQTTGVHILSPVLAKLPTKMPSILYESSPCSSCDYWKSPLKGNDVFQLFLFFTFDIFFIHLNQSMNILQPEQLSSGRQWEEIDLICFWRKRRFVETVYRAMVRRPDWSFLPRKRFRGNLLI